MAMLSTSGPKGKIFGGRSKWDFAVEVEVSEVVRFDGGKPALVTKVLAGSSWKAFKPCCVAFTIGTTLKTSVCYSSLVGGFDATGSEIGVGSVRDRPHDRRTGARGARS
jgi:hypothetical protein